jgi:hypothetical protein
VCRTPFLCFHADCPRRAPLCSVNQPVLLPMLHVFLPLLPLLPFRSQIRRIREKVLDSLLRQEVAFFDIHSAGDLSALVADATMRMQAGMGQKLGVTVHNLVRPGCRMMLAACSEVCEWGWGWGCCAESAPNLLTKVVGCSVKAGVLG